MEDLGPRKRRGGPAYAQVLGIFRAAWEGEHGAPYMPTPADEAQLGRLMRTFDDSAAILAYPWGEVFANYFADKSPWVAEQQGHSLKWFCTDGGASKYRMKRALHLTAKTRANLASQDEWLEMHGVKGKP